MNFFISTIGIMVEDIKIIFMISPRERWEVPNIGSSTGKYTTASCSRKDANIAAARYLFARPTFNIDFSDCEFKAWKSWKKTIVVNAIVCAFCVSGRNWKNYWKKAGSK